MDTCFLARPAWRHRKTTRAACLRRRVRGPESMTVKISAAGDRDTAADASRGAAASESASAGSGAATARPPRALRPEAASHCGFASSQRRLHRRLLDTRPQPVRRTLSLADSRVATPSPRISLTTSLHCAPRHVPSHGGAGTIELAQIGVRRRAYRRWDAGRCRVPFIIVILGAGRAAGAAPGGVALRSWRSRCRAARRSPRGRSPRLLSGGTPCGARRRGDRARRRS